MPLNKAKQKPNNKPRVPSEYQTPKSRHSLRN